MMFDEMKEVFLSDINNLVVHFSEKTEEDVYGYILSYSGDMYTLSKNLNVSLHSLNFLKSFIESILPKDKIELLNKIASDKTKYHTGYIRPGKTKIQNKKDNKLNNETDKEGEDV